MAARRPASPFTVWTTMVRSGKDRRPHLNGRSRGGSVWLTRSHPATVCSHCVCVCLFCGRSGCSAPLLQQDAGSAVCSRVCVVPSWQETPQQAVCWANVGLYLFGDRVELVLREYLHFDFSFSSNLSGGWQKNSHSVLKWKYLCKKVKVLIQILYSTTKYRFWNVLKLKV